MGVFKKFAVCRFFLFAALSTRLTSAYSQAPDANIQAPSRSALFEAPDESDLRHGTGMNAMAHWLQRLLPAQPDSSCAPNCQPHVFREGFEGTQEDQDQDCTLVLNYFIYDNGNGLLEVTLADRVQIRLEQNGEQTYDLTQSSTIFQASVNFRPSSRDANAFTVTQPALQSAVSVNRNFVRLTSLSRLQYVPNLAGVVSQGRNDLILSYNAAGGQPVMAQGASDLGLMTCHLN